MSLGRIYFRVCNTCEAKAPESLGAAQSVEVAEQSGWVHHGSFDFCPKCRTIVEKILEERSRSGWKEKL